MSIEKTYAAGVFRYVVCCYHGRRIPLLGWYVGTFLDGWIEDKSSISTKSGARLASRNLSEL